MRLDARLLSGAAAGGCEALLEWLAKEGCVRGRRGSSARVGAEVEAEAEAQAEAAGAQAGALQAQEDPCRAERGRKHAAAPAALGCAKAC